MDQGSWTPQSIHAKNGGKGGESGPGRAEYPGSGSGNRGRNFPAVWEIFSVGGDTPRPAAKTIEYLVVFRTFPGGNRLRRVEGKG